MASGKTWLKGALLGAGMLFSQTGVAQKLQQHQQQTQANVVETLSHQEKQQVILEKLQAEAIYDAKTEVSYVFRSEIPSDMDTLAVAARHNIFFAHNDGLLVEIYGDADDIKNIFAGYGGSYEQVAVGVYKVLIPSNLVDAKAQLLRDPKVTNVNYDYCGYLSACTTWNDPESFYSGSGPIKTQQRISDLDRVTYGSYTNVDRTHDIDSVDKRQVMNMVHPATDTGIVVNVIDAGAKFSNSNINDHYLAHHDHSYYLIAPDSVRPHVHGQAVTDLIVGEANNSYGGVGVAHDFPYIHHNVINGLGNTMVLSAIYRAQDSIYAYAIANPTKKLTVNMSFGTGNDATLYNKIKQNANLQNHKQVIFTAATGNSAAAHPARPARRSRSATTASSISDTLNIIAVGAVKANDATKPIRHTSSTVGSNTGPEVDFVADGHNVNVMYDTSGSYSLGNGTSFSSPIVNGAVAQLWAQDTTANFIVIYNRLKKGAKDLGTTGKDTTYGRGYARTGTSLKKAVVEDVPTAINCASNPLYTYSFTPKFYNNGTYQTLRKVYYPSGDTVTGATDVSGVRTFPVIINTAKGFSNGSAATNVLKYEFVVDGCTTVIYSDPITISNIATPTTPTMPPTPIITTMPASACSTGGAKIGKLANPTGTVTVTHNSNPTNLYNPVDSSFTYTPVSAPTDTIHVTYNSGLTSTKDSIYTVTSATTPTITTPTGGVSAVCTGTSQTYSVTASGAGATPIYQWYVNGSPVAGATSSTYTRTHTNTGATPVTDTLYCVMTPTAGGCYTTAGAITSGNKYVTVAPNATSTGNISPDADTVCYGTTITFTHAFANSLGSAWTQEWHQINPSSVDAVVSTLSSNTNTTYAPSVSLASGLYKYYVLRYAPSGACGVSGPASSDTVTMYVKPSYTPSVSTPSLSASTVCVGSTITASVSPTGVGATPTYQWYVNGSPIAGATTNPWSYTPAISGTHNITCVVKPTVDPMVCYTADSVISALSPLTVNPYTVATTNMTPNSVNVCQGASSSLVDSFSATGTTPWTTERYKVGTAAPVATFTGTGNTTYTPPASLSAGTHHYFAKNIPPVGACGATALFSDTMTYTVNPSIAPTADIFPNNQTICENPGTTTLTYSVAGSAGATYNDSLMHILPSSTVINRGAIAPGAFTTMALTPGVHKFFVKKLLANGTCALPTVYSDTVTIHVTAALIPDATISGPTDMCEGVSFSVTATPKSSVPTGSTVKFWKQHGASAPVMFSSSTYTGSPLSATTTGSIPGETIWTEIDVPASACAVDANGDTMNVNIDKMPNIPLLSLAGAKMTVTNVMSGATYQWQVRNSATSTWNDISGATATSHTAPVTGKYRVVVTNGTCAPVPSAAQNMAVVGIDDADQGRNSLGFYPNPTDGDLHIDGLHADLDIVATVVNVLGQVVSESKLVHINGKATISLRDMPAGTYVVTLTDNKKGVVRREKIMKK